jgi:hypothetical protein
MKKHVKVRRRVQKGEKDMVQAAEYVKTNGRTIDVKLPDGKIIKRRIKDLLLEHEARTDQVRRMVEALSQPGSYDFSEYQYGLASGLILALSTLEGKEPKFLKRPKIFRSSLRHKVRVFVDGLPYSTKLAAAFAVLFLASVVVVYFLTGAQ